MLIKFSQPNDFKYHGRDVLIESSEIYSVQQVDDGTELRTRSGDHWIVKQSPREVRKLMAETNRLWVCNPMSDLCGGCVECLLKQSQHYCAEQEKATRAWSIAALKAGLYCGSEDVSTPDKWLAAQLNAYERLKVPPFAQDQTRLKNITPHADFVELEELTAIGEAWRADSSLEKWFPFTAEELAALKARHGELYRLVELYLTTPNTDPIVADHYSNLCAWFVQNKRPDGSEPLPIADGQQWQEL